MNRITKNEEEIGKMRVAGKLAADVLDMIGPYVAPGVSTAYLDALCVAYMMDNDCRPAPLGYTAGGSKPPFPKSVCTSVNHVVCHGIPKDDKILKEGDILNIDTTVVKDGFHGDHSRMFYVGEPGIMARRLAETAKECLHAGISVIRDGAHLGDIGAAISKRAAKDRFSVVEEYTGHGIGEKFHEPPNVPHYGKPGTGMVLKAGMTFTVEPMINQGSKEIRHLPDQWTVVTKDHKLSAQWEHTILVTEEGSEVLTAYE